MKITPGAHIRKMSGASDNLIYSVRENMVYARSRSPRCRHFTQEQQTAQQYMAEAARHWKTLDPIRRSDWTAYAKEFFPANGLGRLVSPNGSAIFSKSAIIRQVLGLPIILDAPSLEPPLCAGYVTLIAGQNDNTLRLRIQDNVPKLHEYALAVRTTAPLDNLYYDPKPRAFRYCCGMGLQSIKLIEEQQQEMIFSPLLRPVSAGQYIGIMVHLVRIADGIAGETAPVVMKKP